MKHVEVSDGSLIRHVGLRWVPDRSPIKIIFPWTRKKLYFWTGSDSNNTYYFRYLCDLCNYLASKKSHLKRHKDSIHFGIKGPVKHHCDQCEYAARDRSNLKRHIESKHEGIMYPCDQCEHTATTMGNLKKHRDIKHEGIIYPCDKCDYNATEARALRKHREAKHKDIETDESPYI